MKISKLNKNFMAAALAFSFLLGFVGPMAAFAVEPVSTLHVIKLVVNGSGGTGTGISVPSDFNVHVKDFSGADISGSPAGGLAAPGTAYTLSPGVYTLSEDPSPSYVRTFVGTACDSSGNVTLASGDDKICTIVNTDIPPPPIMTAPAGSGVGYAQAIGMLEVPSPLALLGGSGSVTYNYAIWNIGGQGPLTNITVTDDKCNPVAFLSGDSNKNGKLEQGETWRYSCTATLSKTTVNTAVVTGYGEGGANQAAIATAVTTVVVAEPAANPSDAGLLPPIINVVKVPGRLTPLPSGGGNVTYSYIVTNPGMTAMHDVALTDDKCAPVSLVFGDSNKNNLLDQDESWVYTCSANITASTRNVASVEGKANGFTALSYAFSTVLVSAPGLPNTGSAFGGQVKAIAINLGKGSGGNDVLVLQQFLISENKGPAAEALSKVGPTAYFGELTRAALVEFQTKAGINPPLGNFGPITRSYISAH